VYSLLTNVLFLFTGTVCGAALGGLFVKLFVPRAAMGWDGIANALGGLMIGALIGFAISVLLIFRLSLRRRLQVISIETAFVLAVIIGVRLTRESRPEPVPIVRQQSFKPVYRLRINVGHSEDVLRAVKPGEEPIPFTLLKLWTAIPELEHTGWGPDFPYCKVEPSREDLGLLVPLVEAASEESRAGSCLTPQTDDLGVSFNIMLNGEKTGASIQEGCFSERPQLLALTEAVAGLAQRLCSPSR